MLNELQQFALIYLASPYTLYHKGREDAWIEVCRLAGQLMNMGLSIYSPIAHSHPIATYGDLDHTDEEFWMCRNQHFIAKSDAILIAEMEGWDESVGMADEIKRFQLLGKPRFHVNPETLVLFQCILD